VLVAQSFLTDSGSIAKIFHFWIQNLELVCATGKHAHTATTTFASRYREIEKNKVNMIHNQTKNM
jgi:uncharacterized membrane protein